MTGKAKLNKHTVKEIVAKIDEVTTNYRGGLVGVVDYKELDKGGHVKLACPVCKEIVPDVKSMQIHHEGVPPEAAVGGRQVHQLARVVGVRPGQRKAEAQGARQLEEVTFVYVERVLQSK